MVFCGHDGKSMEFVGVLKQYRMNLHLFVGSHVVTPSAGQLLNRLVSLISSWLSQLVKQISDWLSGQPRTTDTRYFGNEGCVGVGVCSIAPRPAMWEEDGWPHSYEQGDETSNVMKNTAQKKESLEIVFNGEF